MEFILININSTQFEFLISSSKLMKECAFITIS